MRRRQVWHQEAMQQAQTAEDSRLEALRAQSQVMSQQAALNQREIVKYDPAKQKYVEFETAASLPRIAPSLPDQRPPLTSPLPVASTGDGQAAPLKRPRGRPRKVR